MDDRTLGRIAVPLTAEGAQEIGQLLDCIEPRDMAQWIKPMLGRWRTRRIAPGQPNRQQTIDKFCNTQPIGWCLYNVDGFDCVRGASYWVARLTGKVQALDCKCDTLRCDDCYTGGRPRAKCRYCGQLTGWDLEHEDEIRDTLRQLVEKLAQSEGPDSP